MSEGSEFQVVATATEKARLARLVHVLGTVSSGALDDCRSRAGTVDVIWCKPVLMPPLTDFRTLYNVAYIKRSA